jgi:O-antigen/teichoic acid export membrane protein
MNRHLSGIMRRLAYFLGVDQAIFFTLLNRGWSIGAGIFTMIILTNYLSAELQGFYYTFNSLIALQVFVELGLTVAIVQFSSHEMANLSWSDGGTVVGNRISKRRLQSLLFFALIWFGAAALLLAVVLLPVGLYFFQGFTEKESSFADIFLPWVLLVVFSALNLLVMACVSFLEGCGKVQEVAKLRLVQSLLATVVVWFILASGGELLSLVGSSVIMFTTGLIWIYLKFRVFFKDLFLEHRELPGMNWRNEIWPFQWRIGVSWMSGYLLFQLFNPLLFAIEGPIAAGKMGMSMQIFSALNGAAMAWITTKTPLYGRLIEKNYREELDVLFFRSLKQSFAILFISIIFFIVILYYLSIIKSTYIGRILEPQQLFMLAFASLANHIVFAEASYLRAHKEEPFMLLSLLNGICTATLSLLLVPIYGTAGAVSAYVATTLTIGLGYGTLIFNRKRRQWNAK